MGRGARSRADRWLAGVFLDQHAEPQEIVSSAYGWPAFASGLRVNDTSLLNTKTMLEPVMYKVEHGVPAETGGHGPAVPDGFIPLATFNLASDLHPGYSWLTLFGRPESSIARIGVRHVQYQLFELAAPTPYSESYGLKYIKLASTDLQAHPPSGASFVVENACQRIRVLCTPAFAPTTPVDALIDLSRVGNSAVARAWAEHDTGYQGGAD